MIKLQIGCVGQTIKQFVFPGGEVGIQLQSNSNASNVAVVNVFAHLKNSDDVMSLLMASDAVDRQYNNAKKNLNLAYVPYARQDRVCNEGESLSISVLANLINSCNWKEVNIVDPHSDVTPALIRNCKVKESYEVLKKNLNDYYIVAPDAGAYKKAHKWAQQKQAKGVITANKIRDISTGEIKNISANTDVKNLKLLVVDDILDGGKTFIELAKCLKGYEKLELFVTHGIFSKGVKELTDSYEHIYTTNSFHGIVPEELKHEKITWLEI
jgi:ribose-phosphate pyrophosphokinase